MDDMNALERQIARVSRESVEPLGGFDAVAIARSAAATQSPKWWFQSMFSATKFVVAAAIVALLGGFVLAGVLTQPNDETPPAVGASASARPDTSAQPTAATEPVRPTTRNDILPGVSLLTQEVEPGILRILGDDAGHDLTEGHPDAVPFLLDIAISPDGTPWIAQWDPVSGGGRVWALGQPGTYDFAARDTPLELRLALLAEPDGTITLVGANGIFSLDGERFTPNPGSRQWETHEGSWWILDRDDLVAATGADVGPRASDRDPGALALFWPRVQGGYRGIYGSDRWLFAQDSGTVLVPASESFGPIWAIDGVLGYEDWTLAGYEGGVLKIVGAQPPIADAHYLADIDIEKIRLAPDGSIWAMAAEGDGETSSLYRIDPAKVAKP